MKKSVVHPAFQDWLKILREAREKANLTQQELGDELGVHQSFVAKYETGERRVDVIELIQIAKALKVDPASLLRKLLKVFP